MSYRRSLDGDSELAEQVEDRDDVEGHGIRSGRTAGGAVGAQADEDDVEGHAARSGR